MKLRHGMLLAIAVGCTTDLSDVEGKNVPPVSTSIQRQTGSSVREGETVSWTWRTAGRVHVPAHVSVRSRLVLEDGAPPHAATLAFLARYRDVFHIDDPAAHLAPKREERDELGMTHVRLQQVERGVPVDGAEMMAHFDAHGALRTLDSTYVPGLEHVDVHASLTADEARAIAARDLRAHRGVLEVSADGAPALVISVATSGTPPRAPVLAYHLDLGAADDTGVRTDYLIDAHTGAIVRRYDKIQTFAGSGVGLLGDTKPLEVSPEGSRYILDDRSRPNAIRTYSLESKGRMGPLGLVPGTASLPGTIVAATSPNGPWDPAAVDAHAHVTATYDYYKSRFGRRGINDDDEPMVASVHVAASWTGAMWNGKQALFGDGDGATYRAFATALDVVAHELTHGVTDATSGLLPLGDPGALNESIADMFGALVEHSVKPDPKKNWTAGEDLLVKPGAKAPRDYAHPGQGAVVQPAHMSEYRPPLGSSEALEDFGGVHINMGIPNNAFYLMTMGGVNDVSKIEVKAGIGWEKAGQLWYRTNTKYLMSTSGFRAAADANMSAADDLGFTQNEKNIVQCAWIAVGLFEGACGEIVPQPTEADGGAAGGGTSPGSGTSGGDASSTDGAGAAPPAEGAQGCALGANRGTSAAWGGGWFALALGLLAVTRRRSG